MNPDTEPKRMRPDKSAGFPWYDSVWLHRYVQACELVARHHPERLAEFKEAMRVFETRPSFEVQKLARVFDDATMAEIRATVSALRPDELELHEARLFHRFVVHDHPLFSRLQRQLIPLMSEVVGEAVEVSYNFLSMYTSMGVCPLHLDSPEAKWTLDLCVNQTQAWPIHFSRVQPWPTSWEPSCTRPDSGLPAAREAQEDWQEAVLQNEFSSQLMQPGEAIVFSGSSQWHYRNALPAQTTGDKCDLLFFHFIPAGSAELVKPSQWARLFDLPELASLAEGWERP